MREVTLLFAFLFFIEVLMRKYTSIDFQKRKVIEKLVNEDKSVKEIAQKTGTHISTIYRELQRKNECYSAKEAQRIFENNLKHRGRKKRI